MAEDAAPDQQRVDSFAVTPKGNDQDQPGSRPYLAYALSPGATITDAVTLWNYGNSQLTFHLYSPDAFNNSAGAFDLRDGHQAPRDAGAWVKLDREWVTLPPSSKTDVGFTLAVPGGASPGDHTAAIVASQQTPSIDAEGQHVVLDRRTGSRLYLRVSGPVNPGLVVEGVSAEYHGSLNPLDGSFDVRYTVRNDGNIRLGAKQKIAVHDIFGTAAERTPCPPPKKTSAKSSSSEPEDCLPDIAELLPGNSVTLSAHLTGVAATVRVATDVSITPFAPNGVNPRELPKLPTTTATTHAWAIPWLLVILLVVLALVIYLARRRRQGQVGSAPGGAAVGGGGQPGSRPGGNGRAELPKVPAPLRATRLRRGPAAPAP